MSGDPFASPAQAAAALARGEMVIVADDSDRNVAGALVMAAEFAGHQSVNFMTTHARGLVCVAMLPERLAELQIPAMVPRPTDRGGTAFHIGVDARAGATTGISAADRAKTIRRLADPLATTADFHAPGHVFPVAYRTGGVLRRAGHAEASIDLCRLAALRPAATVCEVMAEDGELARWLSLIALARRHGLPLTTVGDLIAHRSRCERLVDAAVETRLPINGRSWRAIGYRERTDGREHVALVLGDVRDVPRVSVRLHSECLTGDVLRSRRCECRVQLELAMRVIEQEGRGVVVYMRDRTEPGQHPLQALDHHPEAHDGGIGMQILADLGVSDARLLTNDPTARRSERASPGHRDPVARHARRGDPQPAGAG